MATKLRAIKGQGMADDYGLLPRDDVGNSLPLDSNLGRPILRRPGDHIETLWLKDSSALSALRTAAHDRQLHPDTAAAIVFERRLVIESLADLSLVDWLNRLGVSQKPEVELWSAHSAYLGHLLHGARPAPSSTHTSTRVSLPIRLIDRLAAGIPAAIEPADVELHHAVAWEVAALLRGETLAEWAYRSALEFNGRTKSTLGRAPKGCRREDPQAI